MYSHVLDQWGIVYDQPIILNSRQAGAAIEGTVRQEQHLERVAVDTHGYTDFGMAAAKLIRFDLCPHLAHLTDRKLYVPRGFVVPAILKETTKLKCFVTTAAFQLGQLSTDRTVILKLLNYGESIHTLQRAIYAGPVTSKRGRRSEELVAISGSLSLLTNIVMAWNTQRMLQVVDR